MPTATHAGDCVHHVQRAGYHHLTHAVDEGQCLNFFCHSIFEPEEVLRKDLALAHGPELCNCQSKINNQLCCLRDTWTSAVGPVSFTVQSASDGSWL